LVSPKGPRASTWRNLEVTSTDLATPVPPLAAGCAPVADQSRLNGQRDGRTSGDAGQVKGGSPRETALSASVPFAPAVSKDLVKCSTAGLRRAPIYLAACFDPSTGRSKDIAAPATTHIDLPRRRSRSTLPGLISFGLSLFALGGVTALFLLSLF